MELLIIALCGIINRIRGGMFGQYLGGRGDDVAAVLFGAVAAICFQDWWALPMFAAAFRLGEAHGWGHWLAVITKQPCASVKHESPIDAAIKWLEPTPLVWALAGAMLRGLLWGAILAIPAACYDAAAAWRFLMAGASMPFCYLITSPLNIRPSTRWEVGEVLMGVRFGIVLAGVL